MSFWTLDMPSRAHSLLIIMVLAAVLRRHWGDLPPMRHSQGTTFVFADGHAIYRKWTDPHTLALYKVVGAAGLSITAIVICDGW